MPYLKVPEFKSNEIIDPVEFNRAFDEFRDLNLDGENFADESLGIDQIPEKISLTETSKILKSSDSFTTQSILQSNPITFEADPFTGLRPTFPGRRISDVNLPNLNRVTLQNLEKGDKFIIRASCVIDIPDGGWRTFYEGIAPRFKIGLVRIPGESGIVNGTTNDNTSPIYSTLAHYRIAYTGKVPSASSLSKEASDGASASAGLWDYRDQTKDAPDNYTYRDTRTGGEDTAEAHSPIGGDSMPFQGYHNYTVCFLYEHQHSSITGADTTNPIQSFRVMCAYGSAQDGGSPTNTKSGGPDGGINPIKQLAKIREFNLFCYQVKN